MIPESFIEELKYRSDIEQLISSYTALKRRGRNLTGLCPFHSEKTPSFVVYPENGSFYCFGCGAGGDVVSFVRRAEHLEYVEAIRFLAQRAGMALPEDAQDDETARLRLRMLELNRETARFFYSVLVSPAGAPGLEYLKRRELSDKTIRRFGLGYAPDDWGTLCRHLAHKGFTEQEMRLAAVAKAGKRGSYDIFRGRVMFPIIDLRGSVIGFGGRILGEGQPKYLNSSDTPVFKKSRGLFAMNLAKATKEPRLILVEGYMDAIAVHQAGLDNAVATLGTALTSEQARLLAQYTGEVVLSYDADAAGQKATRRAGEVLGQTGVKVRVLSMQGSKDPDEYIKKNGAARFRQLVEGSANATEFEIAALRAKHDLDTADGKVGYLKEFCALMARLPGRVEAEVYINAAAAELGVSREAILEQTGALRTKIAKDRERKFDRSLKIYAQEQPQQQRDPQRAANLRYALAEDKLIVLLLKNPDYYDEIARRITPGQFVTDSNRALYEALSGRLRAGKDIEMSSLSGALSLEEMARLAYLLASGREQSFSLKEACDYIEVILSKAQEKTKEELAAMAGDELKNYISGIAAKKK